jgi:cytochrome c biogenesis protein
MKRFIKFFTSIKLAIVLLIILALASILGTLIPQGRSAEEYAARYGQLAGALGALQMTRLYHSIWYLGLLLLFALNIIICTLERLGPKYRRAFKPRLEHDPKGLLALKVNARLKRAAPASDAAAEVRRALEGARYRVRQTTKGPRVHLLGRKKVWGLFGSDAVHLGLLVILAGGIISGATSIRTDIALAEGETKSAPKADFAVRLDKFTTEYYPDGSVKAWKSDLTVLEADNKPVLSRTVAVNHPLTYKGYSFYQTSYGFNWDNPGVEIWAKRKSDPSFLRKIKIKVGGRAALDDPDKTTVAVSRFLPDFVLGEANEPVNRSNQPNNPAAFVEGYRGEAKIFSGWIFANYPDFAQMHAANDKDKTPASDLAFELKSFDAGQFSVLQAAKDPGVPLIWLGCILLMGGLGLAFYWPPWEIKAVIEDAQGKSDIVVGGLASKSREAFAKEFETLASALRKSK